MNSPAKSCGFPRRARAGFSLIELLIVVSIILIIAAIAIPNLLRSRMQANESSAVQSCRNINTANVAYFTSYGAGYAPTLASLGDPPPGALPSPATAGLLDSPLSLGTKAGFAFIYVAGPVLGGQILSYTINANPITVGVTGNRFFYSDQTGVIRYNRTNPATVADTPL